jgi:hypothetical protein
MYQAAMGIHHNKASPCHMDMVNFLVHHEDMDMVNLLL